MTVDDTINMWFKYKKEYLETQIEEKGDLLKFFLNLQKENDVTFASDQIGIITTDLDELIKDYLELVQDSATIPPETQGVLDSMGNIKSLSREQLKKNLESKYYWQ